jgi:hypothetical protein
VDFGGKMYQEKWLVYGVVKGELDYAELSARNIGVVKEYITAFSGTI